MTNSTTDTEIIAKIRAQDRATLVAVYQEIYPMVKQYVLKNNGSEGEAKDVFQDALYVLIRKAARTEFELTSKLSTFLFGVSKNLWLKSLAKRPNHVLINEEVPVEIEEANETDYDQLERVQHVRKCLKELGEPCKTIIEQFYFFKTSMKQIAQLLHYTNANNAKNQKYKCFMRLKKMILD